MNPFISDVIGAIVRTVIAALLGMLVNQQLITHDQAEAWVTGITGAVIVLGWSIIRKYLTRQKLLTALASNAGTTEHEVEQLVKAGSAPPVSLPKHEAPYLTRP
jgi:hypothetical protein